MAGSWIDADTGERETGAAQVSRSRIAINASADSEIPVRLQVL
jgi:hypothetical protein